MKYPGIPMVGSNPMIHKVRIGKVQKELTVNTMKCELSSSCTNTCREKYTVTNETFAF
jgi:hypothetical protein